MRVPERFSRDWWLTMLLVAVGVSGVAYLVLQGGNLEPGELVLYCLGYSFLGDVVTAISMEAVAPTRVTIGPGDRRERLDLPREPALVVSAFDQAGIGRVRVHGETWRARCAHEERRPAIGSRVRVVDREGLTLIVSQDETNEI